MRDTRLHAISHKKDKKDKKQKKEKNNKNKEKTKNGRRIGYYLL